MLAAVVRVGKRFERPPAQESSARAERPSRLVDVLTVVKERLFLLDDVILSPILPEFYGWPPTCSPASVFNLLLHSRRNSLRDGSGGPATDHTSTCYSRRFPRRLQLLHLLLRRRPRLEPPLRRLLGDLGGHCGFQTLSWRGKQQP